MVWWPGNRWSPIQKTAAVLPINGYIPLVATQPDETIAKIQANIIHLPNNGDGDQAQDNKGWQMKECIQQFIKPALRLFQIR